MLHKSCRSKAKAMSELAIEMKTGIIKLAGERSWGETRERWLEKAAGAAGISYRAARSLFYGSPHRPGSETVDSVRAAVARMEREKQEAEAEEKREQEAKQRDAEMAEMRFQMATLQSRLDRLDSEFYVPQIEGIGTASSPAGPQANGSGGQAGEGEV
jgi:hypothetical protein